MVFRKFDRLLFAKSESTPGTFAAPTTSADFFEVIEPTYTVSPLIFERFTKSQTLTPQTQTVPGTAKSAPVASCEISFGIELAGIGTGIATGSKPKLDRLLLACGMVSKDVYVYTVTAGGYGGGKPFFHNENIEGVSGAFSSADGISWSCNAPHDTEFWAQPTSGALSATSIKSEHSGATATASGVGAPTRTGVGYSPVTSQTDPDLANSAVSFRLFIGDGQHVDVSGCKGTFDIAFTHGDRAIINFTFTGKLYAIADGSTPTDHSYTAEVPPAFINASMEIGTDIGTTAAWTGSLFNSMGFSMGNDVAMREDTNSATGYHAAVITGRNPTFTFNPDAVLASGKYDFWGEFLAGTPARMRWSVGSTAGNRMDFRVTSGQFTGISDGERDSVSIFDSATTLTGGTFGSTVITPGGDPSGSTFGSDNEFFLLFR